MSNLFVMLETNEMNDDDWIAAKKIDKADSLIFLVPSTGMIPYQIMSHFYNLKKEPDIYPFADTDILALSFFLGLKCSNLGTGKCYVITSGHPIAELDEYSIEFDKVSIEIKIMDSLEAALKDKKGNKAKKTTTTITAENIKKEENEEEIIDENNAKQEETEIKSPNEVSDSFIELLRKFSSPTVNLLSHKEELAECVRNSSEGVLDTLEFQIKMQIGLDYVEKYLPLLEDHLEELQTALWE